MIPSGEGMLRTTVACVVLGHAAAALANPASIVPTAADSIPNSVDGLIRVDYDYEQDGSLVMRERVGPGADPNGAVPVVHDLKFRQYKHTITPRLDVGIFHDTWVSVALPIVIQQARELRLDSGVDRTQSSTVVDGFLPPGGYDAQNPNNPPAGDLMFRGVDRHGLSEVVLGLGVAPMNQAKDDTKPTWKLGADVHIPVGPIMKFDPASPTSNTGVSTGVTELSVWTSFDRKLGWAEPWVEAWWQVPVSAKSDSLFQNPGFGATNTMLGQQAGVAFGFEAYAIDNAVEHNRISLDLGTRVTAHFEGRDYSEMWEVFAYAGATPTSPLVLDADPTTTGLQALAHPGISNIENYMETAARVAVRAELGQRVRFAAMGDLVWKTDHVISFADAGVDLPTCTAKITTHCETDDNDLVNPGTAEVNPLHNQKIDLVGHRYLSADNFGFVIGVQGQVLF